MSFPEAWLSRTIEQATGCKAYPQHVPRSAPIPFVYFERTGTERERSMIEQAGMPLATFAVVVFADKYIAAKELANKARLGLDNFTGDGGGVTITHAYLTAEADGDVQYFQGEDIPTYSVVQTYEIRFREEL